MPLNFLADQRMHPDHVGGGRPRKSRLSRRALLLITLVTCCVAVLYTNMMSTTCVPEVPEATAPVPQRRKTLIMYATTGEVEGEFRKNIESFLSLALLPYGEYKFLLIINGCHGFTIDKSVLQRPNFEVLERENLCYDAGAWLAGLQLMDSRKEKFEHYIILNRSVRGPFLPNYAGKNFDWVEAFTSQLDDKVKLVGTTLNCGGHIPGIVMHLQSMALATDAAGLACCVRPAMESPKCDAKNELSKDEVILNRELKFTVNVLNAGYSVGTMMVAWRGTDISLANEEEVKKRCKELNINPGEADLYYPKAYQGIDFHPLELMFFKTTREIAPDILKAYTSWHIKDKLMEVGPLNKGKGCKSISP